MRLTVEKKIIVGFAVMLAVLLAVGFVSFRNTRKLIRDSNLVAHSHEVLDEIEGTLSAIKDAETGQRGYIITGDRDYLKPYTAALPTINRRLESLRQLTIGDSAQQRRVANLEGAIVEWLRLMTQIVSVRRTAGFVAAEKLILTGRDKEMMEDIRSIASEMSERENDLLERRRNESYASARNTTITLIILGLLLLAFLPAGYLVVRRDIRRRRQAEVALRESEERWNYLIEHANELIYRTDESGRVLFVNPASMEILNLPEEELVGRHYLDLVKPEFRETAERFYVRQFIKKDPNAYLEIPIIAKDGREVWIGQNTQLIMEQGRIVGFQAIARDITERKLALEELQNLSLTDDLTGLYNRRGFLTLAEQQLKHAHRSDEESVLVFADLDGLKQINDRFGHQEGSNAIVRAARILKETFRESDIVARLGGDEFTVLATVASNDTAIKSRLQQKLREFNASGDLPYDVSMSIGIAPLDPRDEVTIDDLIRKADAAMYEHKQEAKEGSRQG